MHATTRRRRVGRAFSWALVLTLVLGCWPGAALRELMGPMQALASEDIAPDEADGAGSVANEKLLAASSPDAAGAALATDAPATVADDQAASGPELVIMTADEDEPQPLVHLSNDNGVLFSDQDLVLTYDDSEAQARWGTAFDVGVEVGIIRPDAGEEDVEYHPECHYDPDYTDNSNAYSFDKANKTITLHGAWLSEQLDAYFAAHPEHDRNDPDERLRVTVVTYHGHYEEGTLVQTAPHTEDYPKYNPEHGYYIVREANVDYHGREWDQGMLPGWSSNVYRWYGARVTNGEHPEGMEVSYEVLGVESSDEAVVEVEYREWDDDNDDTGKDHNWRYVAKGHGTATLTVTYQLVDSDETDTYTFDVNVAGSVCDVNWWMAGDSGSTMAYPGDSLTVMARGVQHRENDDDCYDGFTYRWEAVDGMTDAVKSIDVTEGENGESVATVTFKTTDELGEDGFFDASVRIRVTASKDGASATADQWLNVSNDYPEIWIAELNSCVITPDALPLGSSLTVTPQVRRFTQAGKDTYDVCTLTSLRWDFDESCVRITAADGTEVSEGQDVTPGAFTLTRTGDWGTNVRLEADWEDAGSPHADKNGLRHERADWHLDDCALNVWLDDEGRGEVFADGTMSLWLHQNRPINDPYHVYVNVGPWDTHPGEEGFLWSDSFAEGDAYTFDRQTGEIVLNGAWLAAQGYDHVQIFVAVAYEPEGQEDDWFVLDGGDGRWIDVRETELDWGHERDRDLLPGWDGSVGDEGSVWVKDSAHPWGESLPYRVSGVEVVSGKACLSEFHEDSDADGRWWYYRAGSYGTATLRVSYSVPEELGGGSDSYTFRLNVASDVYDLDVSGSPADDNVLPGSVVELHAQGYHHSAAKHSDDDGYDYDDTTEGLGYRWEVVEGADAGTLVVDSADPRHATFTAKSPSADKMGFDDNVHVRVYLSDGGSESVADGDWSFRVCSEFVEPQPASINQGLSIGTCETVDLKLVHSVWGEASTTIDDAQFFFWYDPACVRITDAAGNVVTDNGSRADGTDEVAYPAGSYTITRTGDWGTNINVRAVWYEGENGDEYREYWRSWWLSDLDYHLWFEGDHDQEVWVSHTDDGGFADATDITQAVTLSDDLATLVAQGGAQVTWSVGTWDDDDYVETFGPESGLYHVSADGCSITSDAAAMAAQDIRDLRISASVTIGGNERRADGDFWFHLQERELDYGFPQRAFELLPGEDSWIDSSYDVFVHDETHDYEHFDAVVTAVDTGDHAVATVTAEDGAWHLEARSTGDTTLTITYTDYDGTAGKTWEVPVHVANNVYRMDIWATDGDSWALPGETVRLCVRGWQDLIDDEGERYGTDEGLSYQWSFDDPGGAIARYDVSEDGATATVTLAERPAGFDGHYERWARAKVTLLDGQTAVHKDGIDVVACDEYRTITPYESDLREGVAVGATVTVTPRQLLRTWDEGETDLTDQVTFDLRFDTNALRVEGGVADPADAGHVTLPGGSSVTITRLRAWGTTIEVRSTTNGEDEQFDGRGWFLADMGQWASVGFAERAYTTSADCAAVITIDARDVADVPAACLVPDINVGSGWDDAARRFAIELAYTLDRTGDTWTITVPGSELADHGLTKADVYLYLMLFTDVQDEPVWACADAATVSLDGASGHAHAHKVAGTAATLDEEGMAEHWVCDACGKLFADEACTTEVSLADVTIPKLIDINEATVSGIANKTYTGKALTQSLAVSHAGTTLTEGVDYTLGYANNTNAGTATVTVTGQGAYAGTKDVTFAIAPASIAKATIAKIGNQAYTKSAVKPAPKVTWNGTVLESGTDYTVSYKNNTNKGKATVTVTGKGNFTGTKSATFTIEYKKPTWSGASRLPVSAKATFSVTNGGWIRLKSGSKNVTSNDILSISGKTITAKKAGTATLYLLDVNGKTITTKKVTVYGITGKKYEMESVVNKNFVLDIQGNSPYDDAHMIVYTRKTTGSNTNQQYQYYLQSDGTYAIKSVRSGKYLEVLGGSKDNSAHVVQHSWRKTGAARQRWRITVDANNALTFVNVNSNKCFDVQGGKAANKKHIIQWPSNNGQNQKWILRQK